MTGITSGQEQRLLRLLGFLEHDPQNLSLLADAASAGLDAGKLDQAWQLLDRYEAMSPLPPSLQNLRGLTAISLQDFHCAAAVFGRLAAENPGDPALGFNLAWSKAMLEDYEGALAVIDDSVIAAVADAASLKVEMLHHLGRLDEALACGAALAAARPHDSALMGALSTVAIDAENLDLARRYAGLAGDRHDGLSSMGMLLLNDDDPGGAQLTFDRALALQPDDPRAALGKGLALLAQSEPQAAAPWLDKGAEFFGDHLGSWVAAGWAYFVQGDLAASRARFETAMALDDTFAETHGALAVLDIAQGELESARRRTEVALRLDRQCFSAALAKSMLLAADGDPGAAERVRNVALNTPIGQGNKTIAQAMATAGLRRKPGG